MGKKGGGSAPAAPDPTALAKAQGIEDRTTSQYNMDNSRINASNAYGTGSWTNNATFDQAGWDAAMKAYMPNGSAAAVAPARTWVAGTPGVGMDNVGGTDGYWSESGGSPAAATVGTAPDRAAFTKNNWSYDQKLNPESQAIFDSATGKYQQAMDNFDPNLVNSYKTDANRYNQKVADAVYERERIYRDPADAEARDKWQSNLADRGFQVGNEGYNAEMTRLDDSQQRGRNDAAYQAQIQGATQGLNEMQAENAAISGKLGAQGDIARQLAAIRSGEVGGMNGLPFNVQGGSIQSPGIADMTMNKYNSDLDAYNAQQAQKGDMFSNLLKAGTTIGGAMLTGGTSLIPQALAGATSGGTGLKKPTTGFWG